MTVPCWLGLIAGGIGAAVLLALQHGAVADDHGRQWLEVLPPLAPQADEVDRVGVQGKVQRQREAKRKGKRRSALKFFF